MIIRDDFYASSGFPNGDAGVGRAEVDADDGSCSFVLDCVLVAVVAAGVVGEICRDVGEEEEEREDGGGEEPPFERHVGCCTVFVFEISEMCTTSMTHRHQCH